MLMCLLLAEARALVCALGTGWCEAADARRASGHALDDALCVPPWRDWRLWTRGGAAWAEPERGAREPATRRWRHCRPAPAWRGRSGERRALQAMTVAGARWAARPRGRCAAACGSGGAGAASVEKRVAAAGGARAHPPPSRGRAPRHASRVTRHGARPARVACGAPRMCPTGRKHKHRHRLRHRPCPRRGSRMGLRGWHPALPPCRRPYLRDAGIALPPAFSRAQCSSAPARPVAQHP